MARGRPRKAGARNKSGRLKVPADPKIERPSEWVRGQFARFGQDYNSALGRAYAAGLLGEGTEAKNRYDTARKLVSLYGRIIGKDRYRCPLDQSPRGMDYEAPATDHDEDDQEWLLTNLGRIDDTGCRPFFDQLTSRQFTDYGPPWLDRLLNTAHKDRRDTMVLDAAIKAIDAIKATGAARRPMNEAA